MLFEAGSLMMRMWGEGCRMMTSEEDGGARIVTEALNVCLRSWGKADGLLPGV